MGSGGCHWRRLFDAGLVLPTLAEVLGATAELTEELRGKRLLVVLDNLEHLLDCGADMAALLAAAPDLTLLVTSRAPMHLSGEVEYQLGSLSDREAVELFLTRGRAVRRDLDAEDPRCR